MQQPTVISTFAGCGGSSLGYKLAGFKELLAIDFDKHAEQTFKDNFPEVPFWNKNIMQVTSKEILDFTGLKEGELDILDGSPPCQGFSMTGKRKVSDDRNDLSNEFVRLLNGLKPRAFVMENVPGMARGKMIGIFNSVLKKLEDSGYVVRVRIMNAANYGVAQTRERLIFLGIRKDLEVIPDFPIPSSRVITVREALMGVDNSNAEIVLVGGKHAGLVNKLKSKERMSNILPNGHGFSLVKLDWNRPCYTITKSIRPGMGAGIVHPIENRFLTIPEVKRLCSFPDDFILKGKFEEQWARMGNAVMPKFMEKIALTMKEKIKKVKEVA